MSFPVTEVAWRRTNQLRDLVRVLKLRAIDLNDRASIAKQNLGSRFHEVRFAGTSRAKKEQVAYGSSGRVQTCTEHLVEIDEGLHALLLPHNLHTESLIESACVVAADAGIELLPYGGSHGLYPCELV